MTDGNAVRTALDAAGAKRMVAVRDVEEAFGVDRTTPVLVVGSGPYRVSGLGRIVGGVDEDLRIAASRFDTALFLVDGCVYVSEGVELRRANNYFTGVNDTFDKDPMARWSNNFEHQLRKALK